MLRSLRPLPTVAEDLMRAAAADRFDQIKGLPRIHMVPVKTSEKEISNFRWLFQNKSVLKMGIFNITSLHQLVKVEKRMLERNHFVPFSLLIIHDEHGTIQFHSSIRQRMILFFNIVQLDMFDKNRFLFSIPVTRIILIGNGIIGTTQRTYISPSISDQGRQLSFTYVDWFKRSIQV